ncbi:hypothetical protein GQ42DRAFT_50189 [Ramicandelaber brevisporus]|nr:hypothetical protein GQ42DRAFT_50189 [Ramicandelaber brevisporus]
MNTQTDKDLIDRLYSTYVEVSFGYTHDSSHFRCYCPVCKRRAKDGPFGKFKTRDTIRQHLQRFASTIVEDEERRRRQALASAYPPYMLYPPYTLPTASEHSDSGRDLIQQPHSPRPFQPTIQQPLSHLPAAQVQVSSDIEQQQQAPLHLHSSPASAALPPSTLPSTDTPVHSSLATNDIQSTATAALS